MECQLVRSEDMRLRALTGWGASASRLASARQVQGWGPPTRRTPPFRRAPSARLSRFQVSSRCRRRNRPYTRPQGPYRSGTSPLRRPRPVTSPYAVDQLPRRPYRRSARLPIHRQQRFQAGPLRVRQVSTSHLVIIPDRDQLPIGVLIAKDWGHDPPLLRRDDEPGELAL